MSTLRESLVLAAKASDFPLELRWIEACEVHFELLVRWNQAHNLTRITRPDEAARKHYLDCLVPLVRSFRAPACFVDVGSGAGFPGLLAALAWPGTRAILVEPAQKRVSFLRHTAAAMGLTVEVRGPGEGLDLDQGAPLVLSRATFSGARRTELLAYAGKRGMLALWGHPHDYSTWKTEVSTWDGWVPDRKDYSIDGLEPRCLLTARPEVPRET